MASWDLTLPDDGGRAEVASSAESCGFNFNLSEAVVQKIRRIEESVVTAEQRLGLFRVG